MALPNIPNFDKLMRMDSNTGDSDEDMGDLDAELEAILSGKPLPSRPSASRSAGPTRPVPSVRSAPAPGADRRRQNVRPQTSNVAQAPRQLRQQDFNPMASLTDDLNKLMINDNYAQDDGDDDLDDANLEDELAAMLGSNTRSPSKSPQKSASRQPAPQPTQDLLNFDPPPQMMNPPEPAPDYDPTPIQVPMKRPAPQPPSRQIPPQPQPSQERIIQPIPVHTTSDQSTLIALCAAYKHEAVVSKKAGDLPDAMNKLKIAKQLQAMISAIDNGEPVDMSNLPPMPSSAAPSSSAPQSAPQPAPVAEEEFVAPEIDEGDKKKLFNAPDAASNLLDALNQRYEKFKSTLEQAQAEGNSSKVRRIGRIVKNYESAIKANKAGKPFEYDTLPNPPGWDELPLNAPPPPKAAPAPMPTQPKAQAPKPPAPQASTPQQIQAKTLPKPKPPAPQAPLPPAVNTLPKAPTHRLQRQSSVANKQLTYLTQRQQLFKEAALESKKKGDIQQAKEYLRQARGFDPLIEATRSGLPIDTTSIPTPPQLQDDFVLVSGSSEEMTYDESERDEMFRKVEVELTAQIEMCKKNRDHFLALGDYAKDTSKDLDMLRAYWTNGDRLPRYHYEQRSFSIVICNPEVTANECAVDVIKALDLPGKSDIDTYIKIEFPFPSETPQTARTKTVKDNINPEYKESFKFETDRKSRSLVRIFKRHPIKLELWSKGGFLRSDTLVGTAQVKLTEFETKCQLHDAYPLMDGRKLVGGKVEAKVRIREPLLAKQVEEVKEKWLVFD